VIKTSPHIGSTFESWLDEAGIREEVSLAAKVVIASRLADETKKKRQKKHAVGRRLRRRNSKQF
jgi:hypothetical protein